MLELDDVCCGYAGAPVLFGMSLRVNAGEVVALMGRNGMGKTTTIRAIFGVLRPTRGHVRFRGRDLAGTAVHRIARQGLAIVPEGRGIFSTLTVRENLVATAARRPGAWSLDRVYRLFPRLAERSDNLGAALSGGEQQMLAIGRALMTNPHLLVLDEATEGLAPLVRAQIWHALAALKREGLSILVVDKHLSALTQVADRFYFIEKGAVGWSGTCAEVRAQPQHATRFLCV
jgi:branched-chain amino acid transport system ATP-binding protein